MSDEDDEKEVKPKIEPDAAVVPVEAEEEEEDEVVHTRTIAGRAGPSKRRRIQDTEEPSSDAAGPSTSSSNLPSAQRRPTATPPLATQASRSSAAAGVQTSRTSTPSRASPASTQDDNIPPVDEAWVVRNMELNILSRFGTKICKLC
jgi:hypothetical protein